MIWLFIVGGIVIGAVVNGFAGALALGFVGFVVGIIVKSLRTPIAPVAAKAKAAPVAASVTIESLARRVAALEERLARIEGTEQVAAPVVESVVVEQPPVVVEPVTVQEAVVEPSPPPPPSKPNFIVAWFTGGNTIVRVGLVILFFGLAFLVKYGVEHQLIPVELRVAAVAAAGIALLVIGWRLRSKRPEYALSMQGAGVAVLYLTVFGSLKLYGLVPPGMAFFMLVAIAALSAFLAIGQNSLALAVFGASGGFLAPVLTSTGQGSHVMLFSYYLVLNAAIVAIAWFRAWRVLNVLGFLFTFGIGLAWGLRSYRPELFGTTEPFLVAFWLMYVAIAILFARQQVAAHKNYVEGIIVFGVPIAAFGVQAGLMRTSEYAEFGLAFSSVAAGALYLALSAILRRVGTRWILLAESFLALGMVFVSLAIPLALDARWTSAAWALEGAMVVWVGTRQDRRLMRAFGILLQFLAGLAFLNAWPNLPPGPPLADAAFVGMALIALAGLFTHRVLAGLDSRPRENDVERGLAPVFFVWGLFWWLAAGVKEVFAQVDAQFQVNSILMFLSVSVLVFAWLGRRPHWAAARWPEWYFAPVMLLMAAASLVDLGHPLAYLGWIAWPLAIGVHFYTLRRDEEPIPAGWVAWPHAIGAVVLALLGVKELGWLATEYTASNSAWTLSSFIVAPSIVLLAISAHFADSRWPVSTHMGAYRRGAATALLIGMAFWSLAINFLEAGGSDPLPYLPILNAIDLGHLLAVFAVISWWMALRRFELAPPRLLQGRLGLTMAGIVLFIWLNAILLRTMHHWTGVSYNPDSLMSSREVQAALSVFWAALALATMLIATRKAMRALWIVGASLMAVVVVKLVLVDLSHLAGLERIISFIGVGVLMLVIGYFSPVPPRLKEVA